MGTWLIMQHCNFVFLFAFVCFVFPALDEFSSFQSQDNITEQTSGQTLSCHGLLSISIVTMAC
jgi:hypothetical protein